MEGCEGELLSWVLGGVNDLISQWPWTKLCIQSSMVQMQPSDWREDNCFSLPLLLKKRVDSQRCVVSPAPVQLVPFLAQCSQFPTLMQNWFQYAVVLQGRHDDCKYVINIQSPYSFISNGHFWSLCYILFVWKYLPDRHSEIRLKQA